MQSRLIIIAIAHQQLQLHKICGGFGCLVIGFAAVTGQFGCGVLGSFAVLFLTIHIGMFIAIDAKHTLTHLSPVIAGLFFV